MRPIRLTFAGLRSYRERATVDFTDLDLFAIIGDTGAGKSTIIEALSLALYGRKSWTGGAGLADLICDGVNTMSIELSFHANDHDWIVTRARHRNASANVDKLTSPTGGSPNVDGARPVNEAITNLIGLTHDQFTRAVVLPQGRFDELLRATERERTEILSSILGLGDLAATRASVERLRDDWRPHNVVYRDRRSRFPDDPQAACRAATEHSDAMQQRFDALTAALDAGGTADLSVRSASAALARIREALAAVPTTPNTEPSIELQSLHALGAELAADAAGADLDAETASTQLIELHERQRRVLCGLDSRDDLVTLGTKLATIGGTIDVDLAELATRRTKMDKLAAVELDDAEVTSLTAANDLADTAHRATADRLADASKRLSEARQLWSSVVTSRATRLTRTEAHKMAEEPIAELRDRSDALGVAVTDAVQELEDAHDAERAATLRDAAVSVAAACNVGDDCPVCSQPIPASFVPPTPGDHESAREAVAAATAALGQCRADQLAADRALGSAEGHLSASKAALDDATTANTAAETGAADAGINITAGDEDAAAVATFTAEAVAASEAEAIAHAAQREAQSQLLEATATAKARREAHASRLADAQEHLARAAQVIAGHQETLDTIIGGWKPNALTAAAIKCTIERIADARAELELIDRERDEAAERKNTAVRAAETARNRTATDVTAPSVRIITALDARSDRARDLRAALHTGAQATGLDITVVVAPLDLGGDVTADRLLKLVDVAREASVTTAAVLAQTSEITETIEAIQARAAADLEAALAAVQLTDIDELRSTYGETRSELAAANKAADDARQDADDAAQLDKIIAVAQPFVANLDVLAVSLRDQHFVAHLVQARETELLGEATRRLKAITSGRFGFVTGFGVVNIASGEIRSPDALSGGERFQAALALALGLVEIASRGAGKLDAVFVDEGFGSLDSSALDVALDTLGTVAGGGKMVALISHLRPVAEYVDTVLHVSHDDMLGSRIDVLDPDAREHLLADDIRSGLTA